MKEKTNFFKKFITSIYDLNVFSKYAKEGLLRATLYALLLSIILGGANGIVNGYRLNEDISRINKELQDNKYSFSIESGILNIKESPIKFEEKDALIYLDKEKSIGEESLLKNITVHENISILILKDGIVVNDSFKKYSLTYSDLFGTGIINNDLLAKMVNKLQMLCFAITFIFSILFTFFNLLINCLIVVAFASLITIFMKMVVKYTALYSLTLYAATLPLIIRIIVETIYTNVNLDSVFIIGTLIYVIFILKYIKLEIIEKISKKNL